MEILELKTGHNWRGGRNNVEPRIINKVMKIEPFRSKEGPDSDKGVLRSIRRLSLPQF